MPRFSAATLRPRVGPTSNRPLGIVRRLGWGVADQGISSLSNFVLGVVAARSLGSGGFGAFTLAYVTYGVVLNAARGLGTDPFMVRFSGPESPAWRRAAQAATATATVMGVLAGIVCIGAGLLLPPGLRGGFIALGVGLPALMLQDSWRFTFFSVGRGHQALINDVLWSFLQIAVLAGLAVSEHATVVTCFLAFGGTAALAAGFGFVQSGIVPRPIDVPAWIVEHRALGTRYLIENMSMGGARQLRMMLLAGLTGLAAVGEVRAAEILMGPFLVLLMGLSQVAVPEAAQVLRGSPRRLGPFCFGLGAAQAVAAAAWGVTIMVLLPLGLGSVLLGPLWVDASALLVPVIMGLCLGGFEIAAAAGLRALGAAPRSLAAQLTSAALYALGGGIGAFLGGAVGSCWGVAGAMSLGVVMWWFQLRRALGEHVVVSVDGTTSTGRVVT